MTVFASFPSSSNLSSGKRVGLQLVRFSDAAASRLGEPSTHIVCVAMIVTPHLAELCGVAEPSSALAAVPKVLARRYRGTIRDRRFAQYPFPFEGLRKRYGRSEAPVTCERAI